MAFHHVSPTCRAQPYLRHSLYKDSPLSASPGGLSGVLGVKEIDVSKNDVFKAFFLLNGRF